MSYDLELQDPQTGSACILSEPHHMKGGTYQLGGCSTAKLNITYNYGKHFYRVLGEEGIRTLYGKTGTESIPILQDAINQLTDDIDSNYWKATEGNAKAALKNCLTLAKLCPNGVWSGD